jgi:LPXTG-motif cell wall-anchored protein
VTASPAPARAEEEIGLSLDGRHWRSELTAPLFDPAARWVPGSRETRSFFVRNQGPTGARMSIEVRSRDSGRLLPDHDIGLTVRAAGGPWAALENGQPVATLLRGALVRDERVRVDVRVVFDRASTNQSQVRRLPLTFHVRLVGAGADADVPDDGPDALPDTGSLVEPWIVWLGAVLIGGGLALVLAARRREADDE